MFERRGKDELQELLLPIRKRLVWKQRIRQLVLSALWGTGGSLALLLLARVFPVPGYRWLALALPLLAILAGMLSLIGRQPTWLQTAQTADDLGLLQRTVTAWENRESTAAAAQLQREDALRHLRRQLPQIVESVRVWTDVKRRVLLTGGLMLAVALLLLVPNPQDDRLAQMAQEQQALEEAMKEVEEMQREVAADPQLREEQKKQLEEMLAQARQALAEADDPANRLNALRAAQIQLEKWKETEQQKQSSLARLQQDLAQSPGMQGVAAALEQGDRELLTAALQQMAHALESLTAEERKQLAAELKKAEEQLRKQAEAAQSDEAAKIADQLAAAAEQLTQGQLPQVLGSLEQSLLQAMETAMQQRQALLAAAQVSASLQRSQMTLAGAAAAAGNGASAQPAGTAGAGQAVPGSAASPTSAAPGQQPAGNPGANAGTGSQQGSGNSGSGQGNSGSGSGNGGAGQGNGSGSGAGGSGNGNGSGSAGTGRGGTGSGAGLAAGSHELVTVPFQRIGDDSGPGDTVGGPLGAGPSQSRQSSNSQVAAGGALPYEEVYAEYEQFARESLSKGTIPGDYQEAVKAYFESIEP